MATSASGLKERVRSIVTCSICLEDFDNPRSLSCLHTFCFKCLEDFTRSAQSQAERLLCPICREEFSLGAKGVAGLPNNFFLVDLLDAKLQETEDGSKHGLCEVCSSERGASSEDVRATVYCEDCGQKLCERCCLPHKRLKGGEHRVVALEEVKTKGSKPTVSKSSYCENDPDEVVKVYCIDCNTNICVVCFATEHQQHQCRKIEVVAKEMGRQIDADVDLVSQRLTEIWSKLDRLDASSSKFNEQVREIELAVQQQWAEMKQLIDKQLKEILDELQAVKQKVVKNVSSLRESLDTSLVAVESFTAYSKELRNKGKPCDVSKAASSLHSRALDLQKMPVASIDNCIPNVLFKPAEVPKTTAAFGTVTSFIGELAVTRYTSAPRLEHILPVGEPVWGLASLDDQLFVLRSRSADRLEVYRVPDYFFQRHLRVPKLHGLADMASSSQDRCLYLVDCVVKDVHRVDVDTGTPTSWPVNDDPWGISVTASSDVLITCDEACKLKLFSPVGSLLREVELYPDVINPCHAVERTDGKFVVCHGAETDAFRRVCLINADGSPGTSYSSGATGRVVKPCHLAADEDGFVFVADTGDQVLMLSTRLGCIWEVASPGNGLHGKPWRLCLAGRRLYVANNEFEGGRWTTGRVAVFNLSA